MKSWMVSTDYQVSWGRTTLLCISDNNAYPCKDKTHFLNNWTKWKLLYCLFKSPVSLGKGQKPGWWEPCHLQHVTFQVAPNINVPAVDGRRRRRMLLMGRIFTSSHIPMETTQSRGQPNCKGAWEVTSRCFPILIKEWTTTFTRKARRTCPIIFLI